MVYDFFGREMQKVVPSPSTDFFTKILPLWYSSIIRLERESPNPHPLFLEETPGLKMESRMFGSIPLPVS